MSNASHRQSWKRFTSAVAALSLAGLAGTTDALAQSTAPPIIQVQATARPLNTQRPVQASAQSRSVAPQAPKSEVQRELEKLYEKDGRAMPEMVDIRSAPPAEQTPQQPAYQPPAQQPAVQQPAYQPQPAAQPAQAPVAAQPVGAPKRGLLNKLFGRKETAPSQPPVEPVYTPPSQPARVAAPVAPPAAASVAGAPNYSQIFDEPQTPAQAPQTFTPPVTANAVQPLVQPELPVLAEAPAATDPLGFEAPLFEEAPAQASADDSLGEFDAAMQPPVNDTVELGDAAEFPSTSVAAAPVAPAAPAQPADPFSDDALFPSEAPVAAAPAVTAEAPLETPVLEEPLENSVATTPAEETPALDIPAEPAPEETPYTGLSLDDEPVQELASVRQPVAMSALPLPNEPAAIAPDSDTQYPTSASADEPPLTFDPQESLPATLRPIPRNAAERTQAKQEMIAARKSLPGLKGFCPVALRDTRELIDAQSQYRVVYNNKTYYLGSSSAVETFLGDPAKYAPASRGADVIQLAVSGEESEGSLEHAVWYKGRLYMFTSAETMDTFVSAPSSHATLD